MSAIEALRRVKTLALVVPVGSGIGGVDIANASNSLPWRVIRRWDNLTCLGICGTMKVTTFQAEKLHTVWPGLQEMEITRLVAGWGSRQRYVLFQLIWNRGIDSAFDAPVLSNTFIFADGILWSRWVKITEAVVGSVFSVVGNLGWMSSIQKNEALCLHVFPGSHHPLQTWICVGGDTIRVRDTVKSGYHVGWASGFHSTFCWSRTKSGGRIGLFVQINSET